MKIRKLINIINKLADRKSEKRINQAENKARQAIDKAEKRAIKAETYFLTKEEKREKQFDNKLAFVNRLRIKTQEQCQAMLDETKKECDERNARSKGFLIQAKQINDKIQESKTIVSNEFETVKNKVIIVTDHAGRADHQAHLADELLRRIQ